MPSTGISTALYNEETYADKQAHVQSKESLFCKFFGQRYAVVACTSLTPFRAAAGDKDTALQQTSAASKYAMQTAQMQLQGPLMPRDITLGTNSPCAMSAVADTITKAKPTP